MKASLSFSNDANLVERRTAKRQAQSILKTGFIVVLKIPKKNL
ncbi:MAG: hypothetical protein ACXACX_06965 [Candidatus Hodarchaeales archaeon]|jgi:hypothetical protein